MSDYGIQPTGYVRKPLSVILAEMEQRFITEFGPGVIQTPQSPLGQLNGLMADLIAELWELGEVIYNSYDPDQAEGVRLDILGRLRLIERQGEESDASFRQSLTNVGTARVSTADLVRAVRNVAGVTFARVFVNDTTQEDPTTTLPPNSVAVVALGGYDEQVAAAINAYIVPGVTTYGGTAVTTIDEGFCRTLRIVRPTLIDTHVTINVNLYPDRLGCPPPSSNAVREAAQAYLTAPETRPHNGMTITAHYLRTYLEGLFPNVEVLKVTGTKDDVDAGAQDGIPFGFFEIADVTQVTVEVA